MPSQFDDSGLPVIRLAAIGESSDADIAERLAFLDRFLVRGQPGVLIFDARRSAPLKPLHRKRWAEWLRRNDGAIRRLCLSCFIITSSALTRGVFTGVFWLWRPPCPVSFVAGLAEAERLAREVVAKQPA